MSSYQIGAYGAEVTAVPAGTEWPDDFDATEPTDKHGVAIVGGGNSFAMEGNKAELRAAARAFSAAVESLPDDAPPASRPKDVNEPVPEGDLYERCPNGCRGSYIDPD